MKRECYLCHKIIDDDFITKCPSCQAEVLFPVKEEEPQKLKDQPSEIKITIGGDTPVKEKRKITLPKIDLDKLWGHKKIISTTPKSDIIQLDELYGRFDKLESIILNLPQTKIIENIKPVQTISDIDELIHHQKITQMFLIFLMILVFMLFVVLII